MKQEDTKIKGEEEVGEEMGKKQKKREGEKQIENRHRCEMGGRRIKKAIEKKKG